MDNLNFLWIATSSSQSIRDLDEIFLTKKSAEDYIEAEIKRCKWNLNKKIITKNYTIWECQYLECEPFELYISKIFFNKF